MVGALSALTAYHPMFCEENVWKLAKLNDAAGWIVFITNPDRTCAMWNQVASDSPTTPIAWDYHVIWVSPELLVWDLDNTCGYPQDLKSWFEGSFPPVDLPTQYRPHFHIVAAERFLAHFSSDRRHMKTSTGAWQSPPPLGQRSGQMDRTTTLASTSTQATIYWASGFSIMNFPTSSMTSLEW